MRHLIKHNCFFATIISAKFSRPDLFLIVLAITILFFIYFRLSSKHQYNFYHKYKYKNVYPVKGTGFEPTTWVSSHNHKTTAPTRSCFTSDHEEWDANAHVLNWSSSSSPSLQLLFIFDVNGIMIIFGSKMFFYNSSNASFKPILWRILVNLIWYLGHEYLLKLQIFGLKIKHFYFFGLKKLISILALTTRGEGRAVIAMVASSNLALATITKTISDWKTQNIILTILSLFWMNWKKNILGQNFNFSFQSFVYLMSSVWSLWQAKYS